LELYYPLDPEATWDACGAEEVPELFVEVERAELS